MGGIFEVRIYPAEFSIRNILATCADKKSKYGVNLAALNATLSTMDNSAIRRRRKLFSRLYHEAIITYEHGKGISFTDMLLLLAHHKLIVDKEALM